MAPNRMFPIVVAAVLQCVSRMSMCVHTKAGTNAAFWFEEPIRAAIGPTCVAPRVITRSCRCLILGVISHFLLDIRSWAGHRFHKSRIRHALSLTLPFYD